MWLINHGTKQELNTIHTRAHSNTHTKLFHLKTEITQKKLCVEIPKREKEKNYKSKKNWMINDCYQRFFLSSFPMFCVAGEEGGRCVRHRRTQLKCRTRREPIQLLNSCEARFALRLTMSLVFHFSRFWPTSWIIRYAMNDTQFKDGPAKVLKNRVYYVWCFTQRVQDFFVLHYVSNGFLFFLAIFYSHYLFKVIGMLFLKINNFLLHK